jgi:hypothetical protein
MVRVKRIWESGEYSRELEAVKWMEGLGGGAEDVVWSGAV